MKELFDVRVVIREMTEGEASKEMLDACEELSMSKIYLEECKEDAVLAALTDFFNQKNVQEKEINPCMIDKNAEMWYERDDINATYHCFKFNDVEKEFKGLCIEVIMDEHLFKF